MSKDSKFQGNAKELKGFQEVSKNFNDFEFFFR